MEETTEIQFAEEDIRLIIWDLDETFWEGTLTEGGIAYRADHHQLVLELARRGIMSAICSKNDHDTVAQVLRQKGIWDSFIFPSIDWTPKGPRIRSMLARIGLRPQSVLFIDDNPMNLAQAAAVNDGLNVASPSVIPLLADAKALRGRPDPTLSRLRHYKVQERKAQASEALGNDPREFLRASNVTVYFDYDVEARLDRVVELINRTNQLNYTKDRVTDVGQLRQLIRHNTSDAALIRVCDRYGDYGYVGFYLTQRMNNRRRLIHFCFSCRILNMFVEHWVYAFLGRPALQVVGSVLSDVLNDPVEVDWITARENEDNEATVPAPAPFDTIVARGGCDLASVMHYLSLHTRHQVEEFNMPRNHQVFRRDHSAFLQTALQGRLTPDQIRAARALGYEPADFETDLFGNRQGRTLYLLSFWADADIPVYRHKRTGLQVPYWLVGGQHHNLISRSDLQRLLPANDLQRQRLTTLCAEYEHHGILTFSQMTERYAAVLDALPGGAEVVLMLANERGPAHFDDPDSPGHTGHVQLNNALRHVAKGRSSVMLLDPAEHINGSEELLDLNHFRRDVYFRMARQIKERFSLPAFARVG